MIGKIDLSGNWELYLDSKKQGVLPQNYDDIICLPNSTSNARKGEDNPAREEGFLTDSKLFEGHAWFSRTVDLSAAEGKTAKLYLERTRMTKLYIDGEFIGGQDSLTTAHIYDISKYTDGTHTITVCVSNVDYPTKGGHLTSPDTQSNWNGITGEISVRMYEKVHAEEVRVYPLFEQKAFRVSGKTVGAKSGTLCVSAQSVNFPAGGSAHIPDSVQGSFENGEFSVILPLGNDARTWDEYSPEFYKVTVTIGGDSETVSAGLKSFVSDGDKFRINGRKTFLRGKHDGMIFPKTGFAPTSTEEWLRVLKISRSYGINHYRFHTCCPPEAAFEAADLLGIYMEPQLPFWGTIQAPGEEGFNEDEQNYLIAEGFRMLSAYGDHPSFCMMSMGNELWGSTSRLNDIIGAYKKFDPRHLYTQGSNNFQWFPNVVENDDYFVGVRLASDRLIRGSYAMCDAPLGHVQTDKPAACHNYENAVHPSHSAEAKASEDGTVQIQYGTTMKTVKATDADADFIPKIPIVTHEIGQYETYPNFKEIEKYTGSLKARNFEIFRERLEQKGLGALSDDYFKASGALAAACYKQELEAVFRSPSIGGFQILDIQDFSGQGTALVGMLDAFMDDKGICSADEWREFCNDTVILAEFDDHILESEQMFNYRLRLTNFRPSGICGRVARAKLVCECGTTLDEFECIIPDSDENYILLGERSIKLPEFDEPKNLTLTLLIEDTDVRNHYKFTVFPKRESVDISGAYIFSKIDDEAEKLLAQGKTLLILPDREQLKEKSVEGFYCQDFWCYPMFRTISQMMNKPEPIGTMGLLIDKDHPALAHFHSKTHSTPQWWEIVTNSVSEILDGNSENKRVIVRTIDNFERNHDLALLYEYETGGGKALVCCCDLEKAVLSPEGRQFAYSLIEYVKECNKRA